MIPATLEALQILMFGRVLEPPTLAEQLVDLARIVKYPRNLLLVPTDHCITHLHRVKLALDLDRRGGELVLRAVVENWDIERIVRELY